MKTEFWTIMIGDKFLNSNLFRKENELITEAVKFTYEEDCREYFNDLRKDKPFKIVKVKCELEEVDKEGKIMRIEVNDNLMEIRIYDGVKEISRLKFNMCDKESLVNNSNELLDLFSELNIKCKTVYTN